MRALFTGLLAAIVAASLTGCATLPHDEQRASPTATASKAGAKHAKPIKSRKAKAVASVKYTGSTTASRGTRPGAAPATDRAKAAVAAMLETPASAEFYNLKRAQKKLLHRTMDTICGYVKAKSGAAARNMPFVYTVDDGEAYLVDGRSHVAASVHGALCK